MYHYVRPISPSLPNLRYLPLDHFSKQLDWLCKAKRPLGREEIEGVILGERKVTDGFILTFDDGLIDHYEFVLPELLRRELTAIFFIPTGPYIFNKLLNVHRVHILLGKFEASEIVNQLHFFQKELDICLMQTQQYNRYTTHNDNETTKYFKRLINYELDSSLSDLLLEKLFSYFDVKMNLNDYYLSLPQIKTMLSEGMMIGSHSINHRPMNSLTLEDQESEISHSFSWLESNFGSIYPRTFCYPYGGFDTFSLGTEKLLTQYQVSCSFSVEPRGITQMDINSRPHALPRFDCNELPFGKSNTN